MRAAVHAALVVVCAVTACAQAAPSGSATRAEMLASADTLRGRLEVVGAEPATSVALMDSTGSAVTLVGELQVLRSLTGLEVVVWGEAEGSGGFRVSRFAVRAHAGVPAVDGVLVREGEGWFLTTEGGERRPIPRLPEALRGSEGARIWIAGPLRAPDAFGVINP